MHRLVPKLLTLCEEAAAAIMQIYRDGSCLQVDIKDDASPVTSADRAAQRVLLKGLAGFDPAWPILSEESDPPSWQQRQAWSRYWLVDPLDGTKEFLARTDEFAISVALVEDGRPLLGIIYAPVTGDAYWGGAGLGAFARRNGETAELGCRTVADRLAQDLPLEAALSRRHNDPALNNLLQQVVTNIAPVALKPLGSALKFGALAAGEADFYPRLGPTSEWDTAAGQAILEGAGGAVWDMRGQVLTYNTKPGLLNPAFIAVADPGAWKAVWPRLGLP